MTQTADTTIPKGILFHKPATDAAPGFAIKHHPTPSIHNFLGTGSELL
jgi:hypothetical protein